MYQSIYEELEQLDWPDARRLSKEQKDRIIKETSFLDDSEVKKFNQRLFCIHQRLTHAPVCPVCGSRCKYSPKKKWEDVPYGGWTKYCSRECAYQSKDRMDKFKGTMKERYGVEFSGQSKELRKKSQDTLEERTGHRFALQVEEHQSTFRKTMTERYGSEYTMSSDVLFDKVKNSMVDRYGVEHARQNDEINQRAKNNLRERYGVEVPLHNEDIRRSVILGVISEKAHSVLSSKEQLYDLYVDKKIDTTKISKDLDVCRTTVVKYLHYHNIPIDYSRSESYGERELRDFIRSLDVEFETNNKTVIEGGKHLDIYVPEHNMAVEYNGVYYHSTKFKPKNYHQQKTLSCIDKGIRLFHIWEDDWDDPVRKDIIKNKIRMELGKSKSDKVPARKTDVHEVAYSDIRDLLDDNHIQGMVKGTFYNALYHNNEVIAAMVMQQKKNGTWELARFCSNCIVQGGFSKLLNHFKKNNNWDEIITFADLSISHGDLYEKTGFVKVHTTRPIMWYVRDSKRFRRERFMKNKLHKVFGYVDLSKTEREIMKDNGYFQLYDAGLIKYKMVNG
jgi:hypothetical protein